MGWLDINPEPRDNDDEDDYLEYTQTKRVNPYSI
jgi:hypothetical protein